MSIHQDAIARQGKRRLASHLGTWHGKHRNIMPFAVLLKWERDELLNAHDELHDRMTADANLAHHAEIARSAR